MWDTPDLVMAERNKSLYSEVRIFMSQNFTPFVQSNTWKDSNAGWFVVQRLYKSSFEKNRGNFKYTADTPFFQAMKNASVLINNVSLIPLSLIAVMTNRFTSADCIIECELCYNYILCFFASHCDSHFEGKRMLICSIS